MPARMRTEGKFTVTFWRSGEIEDGRTADDGRKALRMALLLLAELDDLRAGDRLECHES